MTKRKEIRDELLKEDAVHSYLERVARSVQDEPKKVLGALIGFFVLLAAITVYMSMSKSRLDARAAELYKAEKILNMDLKDPKVEVKYTSDVEKDLAALKELEEVIAKSSGPEKILAISYKIDVLNRLGRSNETEPLFQQLANADAPEKFFGEMGLAEMAIAKLDWDGAISQLNKIREGSGKGLAMDELIDYRLAKCHEGKGDLESAKKILTELAAKYSGEDADQPPIMAKAKTLLTEIEGKLGKAETTN